MVQFDVTWHILIFRWLKIYVMRILLVDIQFFLKMRALNVIVLWINDND